VYDWEPQFGLPSAGDMIFVEPIWPEEAGNVPERLPFKPDTVVSAARSQALLVWGREGRDVD